MVTGPLRLSGLKRERAEELGRLGYMQWLGGLPGNAAYEAETLAAYLATMDFIDTDPTVAAFCRLIRRSLQMPLRPLAIALPKRLRRGGARSWRAAL